MYDVLHGTILSIICATSFLSVYHLMEISRNLKVLAHLTQENNAILRAIVAQAEIQSGALISREMGV